VAGALVLHRLGDKSYWYDEAFTVGLVDRPLGDALWRITHWELNQSPYYVAMLVWHRLGDGEAYLRLLSAVFAVATVPATYAVGRRLADRWVGAIAAGVVAGHALVVQWGQQVRGYSLAALLATVATLLLLRAVERPTTGRTVAYAVVAAATAYTHLVAGLVLVAHALSLLALRPVPWRFARTAAVVGGVLVAPLGWYVLTRQGDPLAWIGEPSRRELVDTLADVAGGGIRHLVVLGALSAVGAAVSVAGARRSLGSARSWHAVLPVLWLAVPVLTVVVSTYTVKPLLVPRFLVVVVPALAVLVALGIRSLPRWAGALSVAAVAVVSAQGVATWYDLGTFEDWRGAVASVEASARPGDDVMAVPGRAVHAVDYYGPELPTVSPTQLATAGGERLWVLRRLSDDATEWPVPAGFQQDLAARYELVETRRFENVDVLLYERR
jgi:mannosyltransferase